jgi:O-antigen ligase
MSEAVRREPGISGLSLVFSAWHDPVARILNVDLLTVLIAILLPWSTTGVVIAAVLWIIALIPTLEVRAFLRSLTRPICVLPIAFLALALVGTLWSDALWNERLFAVRPTAKLLVLPLLLYHFERSTRGVWVFIAFLASCTLLMAASWLVAFDPAFTLKATGDRVCGVFVKNYIDQSQEFVLCAIALAYPVMILLKEKKRLLAGLLVAIALSFIVNMVFVIASRTALATMPIMIFVFALLHLKWRSIVLVSMITVIAGLAWAMTPRLCRTVETLSKDYSLYRELNIATSVGLRLEFWTKSLHFIRKAPIVGHGTGSIRGLFEQAATGPADDEIALRQFGASGQVVANPHNQTLSVAIQWGVVGVIVLYAMWLFHLLLFRGDGLAAWVGLLVVVQNVLSSLFNSHLFDFHEGWMYVLGVGVAGGMTLSARQASIQDLHVDDRTL